MANLLNFWGFHISKENKVQTFFQGPLAKWVLLKLFLRCRHAGLKHPGNYHIPPNGKFGKSWSSKVPFLGGCMLVARRLFVKCSSWKLGKMKPFLTKYEFHFFLKPPGFSWSHPGFCCPDVSMGGSFLSCEKNLRFVEDVVVNIPKYSGEHLLLV